MLKRLVVFLFLFSFLSFTAAGAFTGSFTHETHGNIVALIPNLGSNVDHYKFVIEDQESDIESETPWIDADDTYENNYALKRGDYIITMYFRNCTLNDFTTDHVHIARQEEVTTKRPLKIADDKSRFRSITESIPQEVIDWYDSLNGVERTLFVLAVIAIAFVVAFSKQDMFKFYILKRKK